MSTDPTRRSYRGYPAQPQQRKINGTAPYAQPQNNKGANPAAGEIRADWKWGSSPDTASDEIKSRWNAPKSTGQSIGAGIASAARDMTAPAAPASGPGAMTGTAAQQLARGARGEGTNGADNSPLPQAGPEPGKTTPPGRIDGSAPYAQPENNKGANPAAGEIRAKWGWGSSPDTASDEIKAQWGQMRDAAQGKDSPLYTGPDFTLPASASGVAPAASNNIPAVQAGKPDGNSYQGNGGTYFA